MKIRQKREEARKRAELDRQREKETLSRKLSPEQMTVYNEAVRKFITLNNRIYDLRYYQKEVQPLIEMLATGKACRRGYIVWHRGGGYAYP